MRSPPIAAVLALLTGACSGDPAPTLLDASTKPDAGQLARCLIPADYGALGTQPGTQDATGTGTPSITVVLDPGPPEDALFVALTAGQGAFAAGLATGTFTISGADAGFATCGLCTNLLADIDPSQGPAKFYFATSGTVTLTSIAPVAGSAQHLEFVEIDLASGQPIAGGCTSTIGSIAFGS